MTGRKSLQAAINALLALDAEPTTSDPEALSDDDARFLAHMEWRRVTRLQEALAGPERTS